MRDSKAAATCRILRVFTTGGREGCWGPVGKNKESPGCVVDKEISRIVDGDNNEKKGAKERQSERRRKIQTNRWTGEGERDRLTIIRQSNKHI